MHALVKDKIENKGLGVLFTTLGLLSGLPFSLFTSTLLYWLNNFAIETTLMVNISLLSMPYAFKPLTASVIDYMRNKGLVCYQKILLIASLGVSIALLYVSRIDPLLQTKTFMIITLVGCFFSSVVDIIVDAARIIIVPESKKPIITSYFITSYRVAMLITGSFVVFIHGQYQITYSSLYATTAILLLGLGLLLSLIHI